MKRILSLICLLTLALLMPLAAMIARGLPVDTQPYVEKKYAGWSGVLRAWVCCEWTCGGGFTRWLNACAADFEDRHEGVYIEFTPVRAEAMRSLRESGIRPPEMLLFSPGVLEDGVELCALDVPDALRAELRDCGAGRALPVAMGGYIWVYNRDLTDGAPGVPGSALTLLPDDGARSFSAALIALMRGEAEEDAPLPEEPGIDLGLPTAADALGEAALQTDADALDRFIAGELSALPVTQAELARLIRLKDAGRGPNWACAGGGDWAYTDQLLLAGVVAPDGDADGEARAALAAEFAEFLLSEDAQARLSDIGAFSVTGTPLYSGFSDYAELDALLNGSALVAPGAFSAAPDMSAVAQAYWSGSMDLETARAALRRIRRQS